MQQHFQRSSVGLLNPMQELMELNLKTIESLSYINPIDLSRLNRPEAIIEKNIDIMVGNGHKLLDYIHQLFLIGESQMLQTSRQLKKGTTEVLNKTQNMSRSALDGSLKASHKMSQTMRDASTKRKTSVSSKSHASKSKKAKSH
jgi:hypothetical protein